MFVDASDTSFSIVDMSRLSQYLLLDLRKKLRLYIQNISEMLILYQQVSTAIS